MSFDPEYALIFVDGNKKDENYILKENEVCTVRCFSSGVVTAVVTTIAIGYIIADKIVEAVTGESITNRIKSGLAKWLIGDSADTGEDVKSPEAIKAIPQVRGAKNSYCTEGVYPYVMGKHLFTPPYIACPYTEIGGMDGEEQYFTALYIAGYSDLLITDFKLGELDLAINSAQIMNGVVPCDGIFSKNNPQIEIQQGAAEVSLYPQKVNEEQLSVELLYPSGVTPLKIIRFTSKNPQRVQIEFTVPGLISYDDKGDKKDASVQIKVEWRGSGEEEWKPFGQIIGSNSYSNGVSTITRCKPKTMRFIAEKTFNYNEIINVPGRIAELRVMRMNTEPADTRTTDKVYLSAIRTWAFDYEKSNAQKRLIAQVPIVEKDRNRIARIGFRIKAGDEISGTMNSLNCMVESCCRTWNKKTKEWSTAETPTQNPASIALKTMQSKMLASNAYPDDKIDLLSFGEFYEWCDKKHFACNGVLTSEKKLSDLLDVIFSTSRAFRVLNGKKYGVLIDKPRDLPVTIINNQNVLEANNTKEFDKLPDGYKVGFIDEYDGYQKNEIIAMFEGKDKNSPDVILEDIEMPFVTNRVQAYKNAMYQYACRKLRPEVWQRKLSTDGRLLSIGCLVEMQDDTILVGIGDGAEIKELVISGNYITGIITDGKFTINDTSKRYGVKVIQADGITEPVVKTYEIKVSAMKYTDTFEFKSPILNTAQHKPNVGDIVSFGLFDRITTDAICFGIKDNGDGTFDCTFIPYQAGVYTADKGTVPEFDSKITVPNFEYAEIPNNYATQEDISSAIQNLSQGSSIKPDDITELSAKAMKDGIQINYGFSGTGVANNIKVLIVELKKDGGEFKSVVLSNGIFLFDRAIVGYPESNVLSTWKFRAKIKNIYGNESEHWKECSVDTSHYGTWVLQSPIVQPSVSHRFVSLAFGQPPRSDNKDVYGAITHTVQIRKPATDPANTWYKPATALDPYVAENNYKEGDGIVQAGNSYTQTLPLTGQNETPPAPQNTLYQFRVTAQNEAGQSTATVINVTATNTNISDIVKGWYLNEQTGEKIKVDGALGAEHIYTEQLSAIAANMGFITGGTFGGNELNHWALTRVTLPDGKIRYEGSMRVGGVDEYLQVVPIVHNGIVQRYEIKFKVGNFEVTSQSSNINGDLYIQASEQSLDRTKITPTGMFFEHRNSPSESWAVVNQFTTSGVKTPTVYSDKTLVITNKDMAARRKSGSDIGLALPDGAKVYHYDTDFYDQTGVDTLPVLYTPGEGKIAPVLKGMEDSASQSSAVQDFTPAVLACAPYSTIAKMLYGNYALKKSLGITNTFTVDFWLKYYWNESQELFRLGTPSEYVSVLLTNREPYYNEPLAGEPQYNEAVVQAQEVVYNEIENAKKQIVYCSAAGETRYELADYGIELVEGNWFHIGIIATDNILSVLFDTKKIAFTKNAAFASDVVLSCNKTQGLFCVDELMITPNTAIEEAQFIGNTAARIPWGALDYTKNWFVLDATENIFCSLFKSEAFKQAVRNAMQP